MTRDELEALILKAKDLETIAKESNEWFSKYHDKNYLTKGLQTSEYTYASIKDEILLARALRTGYLKLDPVPVNKFMNETALKALLAFFDAQASISSGVLGASWSMHADALRGAMASRGLKIEATESFVV
jgi:hypothetical protein